MAWLVTEDRVLASLEVADSVGDRVKGLLGRDSIEGALLLRPAKGVHTLGLKFPIDVAFCRSHDDGYEVVEIVTLSQHRVSRPRLRASVIVEAEAGSFERWNVRPGDIIDIRD